MITAANNQDDFQESALTEEEKKELHIEDELAEMELFFSREFDEQELRFQDYENDFMN